MPPAGSRPEPTALLGSTWYMDDLPWVKAFNARHPVDPLAEFWELLLPSERFTTARCRTTTRTVPLPGATRRRFPADLPGLFAGHRERRAAVWNSPAATPLTDLALAALEPRTWGADAVTIRSPSVFVHRQTGPRMGPMALELEGHVPAAGPRPGPSARSLDQRVGRDGYVLFPDGGPRCA